jgi:hypothetical protein
MLDVKSATCSKLRFRLRFGQVATGKVKPDWIGKNGLPGTLTFARVRRERFYNRSWLPFDHAAANIKDPIPDRHMAFETGLLV